MGTPTVALGSVSSSTPLSDNLSTDWLLSQIKSAVGGGSATTNYFNMVNNMAQLWKQVQASGGNAFNQATDTSPIAAPLMYISMEDQDNNNYYISIQQKNIATDGNGNINTNGTSQTVKGVTYNGIGYISMTCGYNTTPFSETFWWLGTTGIEAAVILPIVFNLIKIVATVLGNRVQAAAEAGPDDGDEAEGDEEAEDASGDADVSTESGGEVAVGEVVEEGAVALGDVFFGVGIALAFLFIIFSFILHNSYQNVRLWNITNYTLNWTIHFDSGQLTDEGQLISGPVTFNNDNSINTYVPLQPVINAPPVPGAQTVNQAHYYDLSFASSSEYAGIGYVMQFQLQNDKGTTVYTTTMYFDIPFDGENSLNVTLDPVSDLQQWYNDNAGNNKNTSASATSSDGNITISISYDYLSGEHVVPNSASGTNSNEQYFYQSVILIEENDLPSTLQKSKSRPIIRIGGPHQRGLKGSMNGIQPKIARRALKHLKEQGRLKQYGRQSKAKA